ncbi:MAG TPA: hypothetical protein VGM02_03250 [Acidobacteriaceae bacterium]|jgi:hypothetical protein
MSKMTAARYLALAGILGISASLLTPYTGVAQQESATTPHTAGVLKPADMANLMPAQVFFRGQSATVQMRNSGGIRYADGMFTLMALVDTSGYSSGIQQRYQAYLITEVPLRLGDGPGANKLAPGAYGVGFIQNDRFVVMDLGAHELLNVGSHHDAEMRRPTPLQVLDTPAAGTYRLYEGRSFVTLRRAP